MLLLSFIQGGCFGKRGGGGGGGGEGERDGIGREKRKREYRSSATVLALMIFQVRCYDYS